MENYIKIETIFIDRTKIVLCNDIKISSVHEVCLMKRNLKIFEKRFYETSADSLDLIIR